MNALSPSRTRLALRTAARAVLDVLLPPVCLTCDQPVGAPGQFCAPCFASTAFIGAPCCDACGAPFDTARQGGLDRLCHDCQARRPLWGQARAALRYDDQARNLVLPFKYADRPELARALAPMMARAGAPLLARADLLVPVPLHPRRLLARRYNQAALLAQSISRLTRVPAVLDGLRRIRPTVPLGHLSPQARRATLEGAFAVDHRRNERLRDASILLVDDILTTGATAEACTTVLLQAGAGAVDVLAAARVQDWQPS